MPEKQAEMSGLQKVIPQPGTIYARAFVTDADMIELDSNGNHHA
jgi:hypothetical protein